MALLLASLTTDIDNGINDNMKAKLLMESKGILSDGSIFEIVIWEVPTPVLGSSHR